MLYRVHKVSLLCLERTQMVPELVWTLRTCFIASRYFFFPPKLFLPPLWGFTLCTHGLVFRQRIQRALMRSSQTPCRAPSSPELGLAHLAAQGPWALIPSSSNQKKRRASVLVVYLHIIFCDEPARAFCSSLILMIHRSYLYNLDMSLLPNVCMVDLLFCYFINVIF